MPLTRFGLLHAKRFSPCVRQIVSTCAALQHFFAHAQFRRAGSGDEIKSLGSNIENKMATQKCARPAKLFYRNLERTVGLTAEKICPKSPEKVDQEKFYAVEVRF